MCMYNWGLRWERIRLQCGRPGFHPWVGKIPWRRERLPTPVFWPGEFHGLGSAWGRKESDTTERLSLCVWLIHFAVHLKLTGHCKPTILQHIFVKKKKGGASDSWKMSLIFAPSLSWRPIPTKCHRKLRKTKYSFSHDNIFHKNSFGQEQLLCHFLSTTMIPLFSWNSYLWWKCYSRI